MKDACDTLQKEVYFNVYVRTTILTRINEMRIRSYGVDSCAAFEQDTELPRSVRGGNVPEGTKDC
jgi:hypothetical protein